MSWPLPPPRSPSIQTTATHDTSESSFTVTTTTDHQSSPARPTHAQRAVRQQASIHLRSAPALSMDSDEDFSIGIGDEVNASGVNRQPSLSFLTHDPAGLLTSCSSATSDTPAVSRRSSTASSSRDAAHRVSALTTRSFQSGMADGDVDSSSTTPKAPFSQTEHSSPGASDNISPSLDSGMAVQAPSPPSKPRSIKSTISTSSRSRKRASNSTIHRRSFRRKYGRWEWEWDAAMSPLIEEGSRKREEELELAALLGRATVLERILRSGKPVSGTPVSSLRHLASHSSTSNSRRAPSRSTTPKRSLSISIRSVRRCLSRRLRRKTSREAGNEGDSDEFTEFDSQSGFGSVPPVQVVLSEKERGWVVLIPEQSQDVAPPLPEKEGCMPSPTCLSSPSPTRSNRSYPEVGRELYIQSPHLGHRSPDHHHRQSVLSYISVGRWSARTQGRRRKRDWIVGMTIGCLVVVIVLTGVLAGVLSKRANQ